MAADRAPAPVTDRRRLGSLVRNPDLDAWLSFTDGGVVVRTGKAELGQGIRTAVAAVAADELGVHPSRVRVQGPWTGVAPNEGVTAGSGSTEQSVTAVRQACAHARRILLGRAAEHLGTDPAALAVDDGVVTGPDGGKVDFWRLAEGRPFHHRVDEPAPTVPAERRRWSGRGLRRLDLAAKIRGEPVFVHDLALPGLRHARVVRPPRPGARLAGEVPPHVGEAEVVRRGDFVAVVADRAGDAVRAGEELAATLEWTGGGRLTPGADGADHLEANVAESTPVVDGTAVDQPVPPPLDHASALDRTGTALVLEARYTKPYLLHGSIGPSAAVARSDGEHLEVWSHSQGVELLRYTLAEVLGLAPDAVTVRHVDGAGCYGHNGADDAALDAALVATARPGTPVSLAWSRSDEHGWEPVAPAMSVRLSAGVDGEGHVRSWQHDVYSYAHGSRPRPFGEQRTSGLLASWSLDPPFERPAPRAGRGFHSGAHRNADPLYRFPARRVVAHFVAGSPLRTSSTRSLGAFANVFAIESFVDEIAEATGTDPVALRLSHLDDPRAREVVEAAVDRAGGLEAPGGIDAPGRGLAFARYENVKAYVAVVAEAAVSARTGEVHLTRAWIAADAGEVIDPDGLVNQLEGGFVQAASWTLEEHLGFDEGGVTTRDWASYPIMRFSQVPEVTTVLLDRPDRRPLGAGEAVAGPTAAAIANAVAQATGVRLRDLPLRPERVLGALRERAGE